MTEDLSPVAAFSGRVKNGVVVPDAPIQLIEGQPVRVELLGHSTGNQPSADELRKMQQMFDEWTKEDATLSDEEADRLQIGLEQSRGLALRAPQLD